MQIVIDIPEHYYENNIKKELPIYLTEKQVVAIFPKGHGRLIDADAFGKELHRYTEAPYQYALKVFNDAPIIIEADKEDKE